MAVSVSRATAGECCPLGSWRQKVCGTFVEFEFEPPRRRTERFHGEVTAESLGGVRVATVASDPHAVFRSPEVIRRSGEDDLLVNVAVQGRVTVAQDGRSTELQPGDFTIYDSARPCRIACPDPFRMVVLQIPRSAFLSHGLPRPDDAATATAVRGDRGVGLLVSPFLRSLAGLPAGLSQQTARRVEGNALGLLATALAACTDGGAPPPSASRTAHLLRAQRYIAARLGDPLLSPASVAEALGLSVRYLHAIFRADGISPFRWIVARRLELAARLLMDTRRAGLGITEIAFEVGFKDASHFTRTFRNHYGVSPREYRRQAAPQPSPDRSPCRAAPRSTLSSSPGAPGGREPMAG